MARAFSSALRFGTSQIARWILCSGIATIVLVAAGIGLATAPVRGCPVAPFGGTLFQLLRRDADHAPQAWSQLMMSLRREGLRDVVVQWSSIDDVDFYAGRQGAGQTLALLPVILRAGQDAGLHMWIGLHFDNAWWSLPHRSLPELDAYFAGRLADLEARLPALRMMLDQVRSDTIEGWYIPDEIDDGSWQAASREAALLNYLKGVTQLLGRVSHGRPVAISAFANGVQPNAGYAAQLKRLLSGAGITELFLQDGIGAGKRTAALAATTARAVRHAFRGTGMHLRVIVELFEPRARSSPGSDDSATTPTSLATILTRISATSRIGDRPAMSFSHVHHLSAMGGPEAAKRGVEWLSTLNRCGDLP